MPGVSEGITAATTRPHRAERARRVDRIGRTLRVRAGLVWTLVRTDFKARYYGTVSGFAWALLKPTCMFIVLMAVFAFLFPNPEYKLNLIIGLILWDFFADATRTGLTSLHAKSFLLTKARCPLWVL